MHIMLVLTMIMERTASDWQMRGNNCKLILVYLLQPLRDKKCFHNRTHKGNFLCLICMHQFSLSYLTCQFQHATTGFTQHAFCGFTIQALYLSCLKCLYFVVLCPDLIIHDALYCLLIQTGTQLCVSLCTLLNVPLHHSVGFGI